MTAKNDITGDSLRTKASSKAYADNYDRIFRKKKDETKTAQTVEPSSEESTKVQQS